MLVQKLMPEIVKEGTDSKKMKEHDVKVCEQQVDVIDENQKEIVKEGTEKEEMEERDIKVSPILLLANTVWVRSPVSGWSIQVSTLKE